MEELNMTDNMKINKLKNFISSLIKKQIGNSLIRLEKKNNNEINDIKKISKASKEMMKKLSNFSLEIKKKKKFQDSFANKILNNNNLRCRSPSYLIYKNTKSNNLLFNKNEKSFIRKSFTPLKSISRISRLNMTNSRLPKKSTKSLDIVVKNIKNHKINNNIYKKKNIKSIISYSKNKKKCKEIEKTSQKNCKKKFNKICKTEERQYSNKNRFYNDISSIDNDIDNINYEPRISNLEIPLYLQQNLEKEDPERISIKLGPLIETLENEKRIYFLGHNLFQKDIISNHKNLLSSNSFFNNSFLIIIEYIFDYLFEFLDSKSLFSLLIANKDFFKLILRLIIAKIEKKLKGINQVLSNLKEKNISLNLEDYELKSFQYNLNTIRAISLLNTITVENFFNEKKIDFNDNLINLIFDLYFISIGKKLDILTFNFDRQIKEKYIINHFKFKNKKYMGPILDYELKHIVINNEIINSLYEYSYKFINIISPNYFQKINKNIALFSFLIKNILEYIGITKDLNKKRNAYQKYKLFCSRFLINQEIIKKLKNLKDSY